MISDHNSRGFEKSCTSAACAGSFGNIFQPKARVCFLGGNAEKSEVRDERNRGVWGVGIDKEKTSLQSSRAEEEQMGT